MTYTKRVLVRYSRLVVAMGAKGPLSLTVLCQQFDTKEQGLNFNFRILQAKIQGGSNMTGTDLCVNKPVTVPVIFEPPYIYRLYEWINF